jgi:two-component system OmpR family sensor kinase
MLNSLRFRLIVSYIAVIAVCLTIIAVTLALLVRSDPFSRELTQERLIPVLNNIVRVTQQDVRIGTAPEQVMADLYTQVDTQTTRVLFVTGVNRRIVADSSDTLKGRNLGEITVGLPQRLAGGLISGNINVGDQRSWVYVARIVASPRNLGVVVAQAPAGSDLGSPIYAQMLRQLALSGCIGGLLSVLMALLIAGSVSSPLRRLAKAAAAIAKGDYNQVVSKQGPTEVQELATNFNSMAEQVRASQQSQRDFLANVSHELKTPLTSIQGFAQAITDGAAGDAESVRRSAGVIQDEAQRMSRMVSELLDLARIESGQIVMRREPVHLDAVLRDGVDKLALRAQQASVTLNAQIPGSLPVVLGDGDRLAQVFTNLLDNALKHTPEGGKVTLAARPLSGSSIVRRGTLRAWPAGVEVSVADTGSGIPPEDLGRIFERFYQVDKARPHGSGLGLGLAIVKQIIEAHYGTITVESVVGLGSRFVVTLPLDPGTDTTQASRKKATAGQVDNLSQGS